MQAQTDTETVNLLFNLFVIGKDVEQQVLGLTWNYPSFSRPASSATASLGQAREQVYDYTRYDPHYTQGAICEATDKQKSQVSKIANKLIMRNLILKKKGILVCSIWVVNPVNSSGKG